MDIMIDTQIIQQHKKHYFNSFLNLTKLYYHGWSHLHDQLYWLLLQYVLVNNFDTYQNINNTPREFYITYDILSVENNIQDIENIIKKFNKSKAKIKVLKEGYIYEKLCFYYDNYYTF